MSGTPERSTAATLVDIEARLAVVEAVVDEWLKSPSRDAVDYARRRRAQALVAALHPDPSETCQVPSCRYKGTDHEGPHKEIAGDREWWDDSTRPGYLRHHPDPSEAPS